MIPVTPPAHHARMGGAWNPWRDLRAREHIRLRWGRLRGAREVIVDVGDGRREVWLDARLGRVDRNHLLAHALVHDERGLFPPNTPQGLCAKEEAIVTKETARRLVPIDELDQLVTRMESMDEPVGASIVMEEFDVPLGVAHLALRLLTEQRRRGF